MSLENQQEIDFFDMDETQLAEYEASQTGSLDTQEESADEADSFSEDLQEDITDESTTYEDDSEDDLPEDSDEEESDDTESEDDDSDEQDDSQDEKAQAQIDYEAEYRKLIGSPIKANGKDITIENMDDAKRLIQMGANYYKKVEQLKPAQKIIAMLENNKLLDESKLSYAIDLMNKKPEAISKLVSDMDLSDIMDSDSDNYMPTDYSVSDKQLSLDNALNEIADTPTYARTVDVLGKQWDKSTQSMIPDNPEIIGYINQHIADGTFDTVMQEVDKQRMLGTIPQGLNSIQVYQHVGNMLYAAQSKQPAQHTNGQQGTTGSANVKPPIKKPSKETVVRNKKAASNSRSKSSSNVSEAMGNVFDMADETFAKKYGNHY